MLDSDPDFVWDTIAAYGIINALLGDANYWGDDHEYHYAITPTGEQILYRIIKHYDSQLNLAMDWF